MINIDRWRAADLREYDLMAPNKLDEQSNIFGVRQILTEKMDNQVVAQGRFMNYENLVDYVKSQCWEARKYDSNGDVDMGALRKM